jgi:hypothetical protein
MKNAMLISWHNSSAESMAPIYERLAKSNHWNPTLVGYQPAITGPDGKVGVFDKKNLAYTKVADSPEGVTQSRIEQIIDQSQPNIIVGGTSPPYSRGLFAGPEQLAFHLGKSRGIPTLSVIDYWLVQNRYDGRLDGVDGVLNFLPDRIAALDELNSKAEMINRGIPERMITVTGNPQHDHLNSIKANWTQDKTNQTKQELGVPSEHMDKYLVILYSSVRDDMLDRDKEGYWDLQVTDAVMRGVKAIPEARQNEIFVLMRNHPGETRPNLNALQALAESYASPKSESGYELPVAFRDAKAHKLSIHPDEMTLAADLNIAPRSNLLTAGTLMDRDCISLQPERDFENAGADPLITNMLGLTPRAHTTKDAINLVTSAIDHPEQYFQPFREKRRNSGFSVDGKATDRVVSLMEDMVA